MNLSRLWSRLKELRSVRTRRSDRRSSQSARPRVEALEDRLAPTTNVILDFDGGRTVSSDRYLLPEQTVPGDNTPFNGFTFKPFTAIPKASGRTGNRSEQVLQILAAVREDYAPFDVNVIWDDRGVDSPHYRSGDTVVMVVNNRLFHLTKKQDDWSDFGLASSVDNQEVQQVTFGGTVTGGTFRLTFQGQTTAPIPAGAAWQQIKKALEALPAIGKGNVSVERASTAGGEIEIIFEDALGGQSLPLIAVDGANLTGTDVTVSSQRVFAGGANVRTDVAFAWAPAHLKKGAPTRKPLRELIDTVSHEAGHTLGVTHYSKRDPQDRQLVILGKLGNAEFLDSRFSQSSLPHDSPETGRPAYSEFERLTAYVGAAPQPFTDTQTGQTLPHHPAPYDADATATLLALDAAGAGSGTGSIDFLGDRDAFQFKVRKTGQYTIRQAAGQGSLGAPVVTLWGSQGVFALVGQSSQDPDHGPSSTITFRAVAGRTYFVVAGSATDRSSEWPAFADIGSYTVTVRRADGGQ